MIAALAPDLVEPTADAIPSDRVIGITSESVSQKFIDEHRTLLRPGPPSRGRRHVTSVGVMA